ncbi:MAG: hypothetical protein ABI421_12185 [Polyangiaceae bacterium]
MTTAALFYSSSSALGQGNDFAAPTGGRSTLMGGTGIALGHDGASPFLNPAGIVRIEDQRLAFSVNFYTLGFTHYSDFHQPGTVDTTNVSAPNGTSLTTNTFRVLPSTLCLFFTIGQLAKIADADAAPMPSDRVVRRKLSICFAQLESEDVSLQAVHYQGVTPNGPTAQVASLARRWSRTYIGPTYSQYLTPRIAIGASINGVYSHDAYSFDGSSITSKVGGGALASSLSMSGSGNSVDLTAIVGATFRASDVLTFGLSVRAPSLHVLGWYDGTFAQSSEGSNGDTSTVTNASGNFLAPSPLRVGSGIGLEFPSVKFEADAALILPLATEARTTVDVTTNTLNANALQQTQSSATYAVQNHPMVNPAIGIEYFLRPSFSFIGGVSANLSTLTTLFPEPSVGNLVQAKTNQVTGSFGLGSYGDHKELLFGAQFQYGWGDALVVNSYVIPNDWAVVSTQSYATMLVISGATDLRSIENAVAKVKNTVVTGDPNKAPPKKP